MTTFKDYLIGKDAEYGEKFDQSDLTKKFIPYFETGQRIEVRTPYGETKRGYVGVTTGWKPVFILLAKSNSHGSGEILDSKYEIINTINKYRF